MRCLFDAHKPRLPRFGAGRAGRGIYDNIAARKDKVRSRQRNAIVNIRLWRWQVHYLLRNLILPIRRLAGKEGGQGREERPGCSSSVSFNDPALSVNGSLERLAGGLRCKECWQQTSHEKMRGTIAVSGPEVSAGSFMPTSRFVRTGFVEYTKRVDSNLPRAPGAQQTLQAFQHVANRPSEILPPFIRTVSFVAARRSDAFCETRAHQSDRSQ